MFLAYSLITAFTVSLLGSVHCIAMCGGFAAWCGGVGDRPFLASVWYHLGRLLSYAVLGAVAGGAGHFLDRAGGMFSIQWASGLLVGGVLVLSALLAISPLKPMLQPLLARAPTFLPQGKLVQIARQAPLSASASLGVASGLLPCGWLYSFVVMAAGVGTWWGGALLMASFWLGTVPILLMSGHMAGALLRRLGSSSQYLSIALVFLAGVLSLSIHFGISEPMTPSCHEVSGSDAHRNMNN